MHGLIPSINAIVQEEDTPYRYTSLGNFEQQECHLDNIPRVNLEFVHDQQSSRYDPHQDGAKKAKEKSLCLLLLFLQAKFIE